MNESNKFEEYDEVPENWDRVVSDDEISITIYKDENTYIVGQHNQNKFIVKRRFNNIDVKIYYDAEDVSGNEKEISDTNPITGLFPDDKQEVFVNAIKEVTERRVIDYMCGNIDNVEEYTSFIRLDTDEEFIQLVLDKVYTNPSTEEQAIVKKALRECVYKDGSLEFSYDVYYDPETDIKIKD